jgi:hypothetical protein
MPNVTIMHQMTGYIELTPEEIRGALISLLIKKANLKAYEEYPGVKIPEFRSSVSGHMPSPS